MKTHNQDIYQQLHAYIEALPTINCHEHLPGYDSEFETMDIDLFSKLDYIMDDLHSAGISEAHKEILLGKGDICTKWEVFKHYYPYIKHTSYGQGFSILLRDFFDVQELTDENVCEVDQKFKDYIKQKNLYERVLKNKSKIVVSMRNAPDVDADQRYFHQVYGIDAILALYQLENLIEVEVVSGIEIHDFNTFTQSVTLFIEKLITEKGYNVFKLAYAYFRTLDFSHYDIEIARKQFEQRYTRGERLDDYSFDECTDFVNYNFHQLLSVMNQYNVTLQIHTGIFANGDNILDHGRASKLNNTFVKYKNIKFDIFHISYPYENELIALSKMFTNVYVDFSWAHAISSNAAVNALVQCLDILPVNKILAFGGDSFNPLFTYAYLVQARQNIAKALTLCIEKDMFTFEDCGWIARRILFDNPNELFGLNLNFDDYYK
jgi:uncharacterized protein